MLNSDDIASDRAADKDRAARHPASSSGRHVTAGDIEDNAGDIDQAQRDAGESPGDTPGDASGSGDPGGGHAAPTDTQP